MSRWLELSEEYLLDFDILISTIDKNCVRADGTVRETKLKRLIKEAKENNPEVESEDFDFDSESDE